MRVLSTAAIVLLVLLPVAVGVARYAPGLAASGRIPPAALSTSLRGRFGVLVIFQPAECAGYRGFFDAMSGIARARGGTVLGIPVNARDDEEIQDWRADFEPAFPVAPSLSDRAGHLIASMGYDRTPLAIVVDPYGRPSMVIPPQPGPYRQATMIEFIQSYIALREAEGSI